MHVDSRHVASRDEYLLDINAQTEDDTALMLTGRDHCIDLQVFIRGQVRRGYVAADDGQNLLDMILAIQNGLERGQFYARKYRKLARLE